MSIKNPLCKELQDRYTPVKQIGKWTILSKNSNNRDLCICDKFVTYWAIIYLLDNSVGYDFPERIPETVKKWIRTQYVKGIA